jgi:prevent-host-death family protein
MATVPVNRKKKSAFPKGKTAPSYVGREKRIAAGEFKAKCLAIIDEVKQSGQEVIITKRGKPAAKLIPFLPPKRHSFIGRLEGIMKINGDPDDLIKPVFPEEDWDMLK